MAGANGTLNGAAKMNGTNGSLNGSLNGAAKMNGSNDMLNGAAKINGTNGTLNGAAKLNGTDGTLNGAAKMNGTNGTLNGAINGVASSVQKTTDRTKWRLHNDRGCHIWRYLDSEEEARKWPQSTADKWYMGLDTVCRVSLAMAYEVLLQNP